MYGGQSELDIEDTRIGQPMLIHSMHILLKHVVLEKLRHHVLAVAVLGGTSRTGQPICDPIYANLIASCSTREVTVPYSSL